MIVDLPGHGTNSRLRPALPSEAVALVDLAVRSKGHWGYDAAFLEGCRVDLALTPEEIASSDVVVCEDGTDITGYYRLFPISNDVIDLDALFVDPEAIGQGIGRLLWQHGVARARQLGYRTMMIQSDPHAEGFYLAMGAERVGKQESTVTPGRMLPLLRFDLGTRGAAQEP
jgi:GNAT superfamily N-acetyltransferase